MTINIIILLFTISTQLSLFKNLLWFSMPTECLLALWSLILHEWHIYLPVLRALPRMLPLLLVVLRLLYSAILVPLSFFVQFPWPVFGKVTFRLTNLPPFWYFCISLRACIPLCIFLCFSIFSSLIIFNWFPFLSFILCALFWFSSLNFFITASFLSPASLALSFSAFSLDTFMVLAISNNGRWTLFSPYSLFSNSIFLNSKWIQIKYINQNSTINTSIG